MTRLDRPRWFGPIVLAVVLTLAGAASVWRATPNGLVLGNDSVTYWAAAHAIGDGRGVTTPFENEYAGLALPAKLDHVGAYPVTLWPPLTPASFWLADLVLPGSLDTDARVLQVLLAGLSAAATGLLAWRLSGGGRGGLAAGAVAGIALVVHPAFVTAHVLLASEPLYLLLQTTAVLAIGRAVLHPRPTTVGGAVASTAAASLTRIIGVSLAATMGFAFVAFGPGGRRRRVIAGLAASIAALVPLVIWQMTTIGTPARGLVWQGRDDLAGELFRAGRDMVLAPATPGGSTPPVLILFASAMVAAASWGWWQARRRRDPVVQAAVVVLSLLSSFTVLLLTVLVVDRTFPIDTRTTLPLLPGTLALLAAGGTWAARSARSSAYAWRRIAFAVVSVAGLMVVSAQVDRSARVLWSKNRAGLATPTDRSADADAVAALDDALVLFANQPAAVYVPSGRGAATLPTRTYPMTGRANPDAEQELDQVAALVREGRAVIVIDKPSQFFTTFLSDAAPLAGRDGIDVLYDGERIEILGAADPP